MQNRFKVFVGNSFQIKWTYINPPDIGGTRHDKQSNDHFFRILPSTSRCVTVTNVWLTLHAAHIPWRRPPVTSSSHLNLARRVPARVSPGGGGEGRVWAGRSTITQVTKIDGKWADTVCPRRHQLPRPDATVTNVHSAGIDCEDEHT